MSVFRGALKRVFLFAMIACLCLAAWGGAAPGEAAATEKATLKSAEELFQAGRDACEAKGYGGRRIMKRPRSTTGSRRSSKSDV